MSDCYIQACRIVAGSCSGTSTVSRVRYRVKVRVRDRCVQWLKCPRTEVTVSQFGPIYHTDLVAIFQCMCDDYVVWDGGSGWLVDDFFDGGVGIPNRKGKISFWEWGIRQHNVGLTYRKMWHCRMDVATAAEWLDLSAVALHRVDKCIVCPEGWRCALPKWLGRTLCQSNPFLCSLIMLG